MKKYIPQRGDFISLTFDPQSGHEQKGRRPAIVVSKTLFNEKTGLALVCPITNTDRGWRLHIKLPSDSVLTGVIMVEQIKSIDFESRHAKFIERAPDELINEVLAILDSCLYDQEF